jgi:hypothetical protein
MLVKTMDYLDHFARFKRKENVEAVERLLSAHQELAKFERAQLGIYHPSFSIYCPKMLWHLSRSIQADPNQAHSAVNWLKKPRP